MDSVFIPTLSEDEARQWEIDFSLLPGDEPETIPEQPGDPATSPDVPTDGRRIRLRAAPHTLVYGRRACPCLEAVVHLVEKELLRLDVIQHDLSGLITQQSYSNAVKASAGTHAGGGVWDVKSWLVDTDAKKHAWMGAGIIPFDRRTSDAPISKWPNHGHVVVAGCPHRTASAAEQEKAARLGRNALQNNGPFRGDCGKIITWQQALVPGPDPGPDPQQEDIPRSWSPKPWPSIAVDGNLGPQTMDRLRMQLNLKTTKSGAWSHWDVEALLAWLGEPCTGKAVITPVALLKLQHRVGAKPDCHWGSATTRALQEYLNKYR